MTGADFVIWLASAFAREMLLFAAVGFLIGGLDDLIVDIAWLLRRGWRAATVYTRHRRATLEDFAPARGRYAVFIPAWDEADVIGPMLRATLRRLDHDALTLFVGCYPNDSATAEAVAAVARGDSRVALVVNTVCGPTTKAQNLNMMWRAMLREEVATGQRYRAVILHDAEDVVAPGELRVFERLLHRAEVVQLPVLPLLDRGSRWISGHYMDEFAVAHGVTMVVREALGASLPLAGTGFAIGRDTLAWLAHTRAGQPFDADSLTEDYELGLALGAAGARAMFAVVPQRAGAAPVAVRAHFPATLGSSVRQKARWMTGIALAGWDRVGWHRRGWRDNWMRMRDRRALLAVLVLLLAYGGLAAWVFAGAVAFTAVRPVVPLPLPEWLFWATTALMAWRLAIRAAAVWRLYGIDEAWRSVPRAIIANLVAMMAARRALACYIGLLRGRPAAWDKTRHVYPADLPAE